MSRVPHLHSSGSACSCDLCSMTQLYYAVCSRRSSQKLLRGSPTHLPLAQVLDSPILGPLTRAAMGALSSELDPVEATPPITRLPFLGLPSIVPVPRPERLYIRCFPLR